MRESSCARPACGRRRRPTDARRGPLPSRRLHSRRPRSWRPPAPSRAGGARRGPCARRRAVTREQPSASTYLARRRDPRKARQRAHVPRGRRERRRDTPLRRVDHPREPRPAPHEVGPPVAKRDLRPPARVRHDGEAPRLPRRRFAAALRDHLLRALRERVLPERPRRRDAEVSALAPLGHRDGERAQMGQRVEAARRRDRIDAEEGACLPRLASAVASSAPPQASSPSGDYASDATSSVTTRNESGGDGLERIGAPAARSRCAEWAARSRGAAAVASAAKRDPRPCGGLPHLRAPGEWLGDGSNQRWFRRSEMPPERPEAPTVHPAASFRRGEKTRSRKFLARLSQLHAACTGHRG